MSSRSLGSLTIDLIAKIAGFEQGMDKAARVADARMKEIERRAKIAGAAIGGALVAGAGLVANQLRNTINSMDELSKAAQRANMPTEEFSRLAYAGGLADVAIQDLQSSMGRLAKAQGDAQKATSQQARIFDALGIATKDAEGNLRNTYAVFLDFADAFKRNQGSPEIMAAGLNLFGRSFQNLVPLIKDGSEGLRDAGEEAERLGLVLSTDAGQAAEAFNDNLTRVGAALRGMWTQIASRSLPQLEELSAAFARTAEEAQLAAAGAEAVKLAARAGTAIMEAYANAVARTSIAIETLANASAGFTEIMRNAGIGGLFNEGSVRDGIRKVSAAFEQGQRDLDRLIERQNSPFRNVVSGASTVPADGGRGPDRGLAGMFFDDGGAAARAAREAERQAERVRKAIRQMTEAQRDWQTELDGTGNQILDSYARRLDDIRDKADRYKELGVPQEAVSRFTDEMERLAASIRDKDLSEFAREFDWDTRILAASISGTSGAAIEYERALYSLDKQLKQNLITQEQYAERAEVLRRSRFSESTKLVSDLKFELELMRMTNAERATAIQLRGLDAEAVKKYGEAIAEANRKIDEEMENVRFMDGIRGEFSDFFTDVITGAESVTDAFKSMMDNIARMITQRIADRWVEQLFGGFGSSAGGSTGGFLQGILGGLFGGGKAAGGWAQPNSIYEVNERGLEMATVRGRDYLLTGNSPVQITPNHRLAGGGGAQITQNFINPRMTNIQTDSQRAREEARKAQRALARV